jgi:hypothetical protein
MQVPVIALTTGAITLERLLPAGEQIARWVGVFAIGAGALLTVRALAPGWARVRNDVRRRRCRLPQVRS